MTWPLHPVMDMCYPTIGHSRHPIPTLPLPQLNKSWVHVPTIVHGRVPRANNFDCKRSRLCRPISGNVVHVLLILVQFMLVCYKCDIAWILVRLNNGENATEASQLD